MNVRASDLFPKSFNNDFRSILKHEYTEYVEAGGRGSCKSSAISIWIIILIMQNKDFNALILRKVSNTLRDSVYTQLKWATEKLGVSHLFNFTLTPLQATYIPTGQVIFFRGADDPLKIKSIKAPKGYIAVTWFEETAEFSPTDVETIKLSSMRGGSTFYNFFSYNPPSSTRSWVNTEFRHPRKDRLFHESSYLTVPPEWLGDAFLFEAEQMKQNNERAYKNIFLGEPTGTGTNVFENIELREITEEEIATFETFRCGEDFGFFPDANRTTYMAYDFKDEVLYILYELDLHKLGNWDVSERRKAWFEEHNIDLQERITGDSAEPKTIADNREWGWNMRGCIKGKGSLEMGFKWLQTRKKIVIDPVQCPKTADEFSLLEFPLDKRTGEIMRVFDTSQPDHSIASVRYAMNDIIIQRGV